MSNASRAIVAAMLGLSLLTLSGCGAKGYRKSRAEGQLSLERHGAQRLSVTIGRVNLDGRPLDNAIMTLLDAAGVPYSVNWTALESVGVKMRQPVRLQMQRVTVEQTLLALLRQAEAAGPAREPLDFDVVRGVVMISTAANLARSVRYSNTYDIRPLLVNLSDYDDLPGYGEEEDRNIFAIFKKKDESKTKAPTPTYARAPGSERQRRVEQLTRIIVTTVGQPTEWTSSHPAPSTVYELNGDLVVTTLPRNHRQIDQLLRDLHASRRGARKTLAR